MLAPLTLRHPLRPTWPEPSRFPKDPHEQVRRRVRPVRRLRASSVAGCTSTQKHESTGQYVDDTAITTKVKTAILKEPLLKSAEINVETFKGRVQLSGFVSSRASIDRAVAGGASRCGGVSSVANDMRVK